MEIVSKIRRGGGSYMMLFSLFDHLVDNAVLFGFLGREPEVAVGIVSDLREWLAGNLREYLIHSFLGLKYLLSGDLDVCCLASNAASPGFSLVGSAILSSSAIIGA